MTSMQRSEEGVRVLGVARHGHVTLEEDPSDGHEVVRVHAASGACTIAIRLGPEGPTVSVVGADIEIGARKKMTLRAAELVVEAGSARIDVAGDLVERIAGDARRSVRGLATTRAGSAEIEAAERSMHLRANDDIGLHGERVRLNCDDPPMPISVAEFEARRRALGPQGT